MAKSKEDENLMKGRDLGVIARTNPSLYEEIRNVAKVKGKKMSEIIDEALHIWYISQSLEDVDPKCLVGAMAFLENMLYFTAKLMLSLGTFFSSQYFRENMSLAMDIAKQELERQLKQSQQPEDAFKTQMKTMMFNMLMPLMMNILQTVMSSLKLPASNVQNLNLPQSKKNIKVEE